MKTMNRAALLVAALIFLLPLSALSKIRIRSLEVTPFGGYNIFENKQNLDDQWLLGGRLGYNFTKHFGLEGVIEQIATKVDDRAITGAKEGQFRSPMDSVDLTFYHIDAVYHFMPDEKLTPFIAVGFGGAHYRPDISTRDMAAFNVGVGVKYLVAENIFFRLDLRDYIVTEIMQESYHNVGITAGLTFVFGGAEPEPAVVAEEEAKHEPGPIVIQMAEPMVEQKVLFLAAEPKIEEKIVVLAFEDIHFDFDKSTLTKEAKAVLKRNIQVLKENPRAEVRIAGYTSASGTDAYNQKLSERRANAVREYLVGEGVIAAERISVIGYGETKPAVRELAPKELYSNAAKANMRVLFEIIVK